MACHPACRGRLAPCFVVIGSVLRQRFVSPGVCALRVSISGAMEFRAFPDFGFDADDNDVEVGADTERLSERIMFQL